MGKGIWPSVAEFVFAIALIDPTTQPATKKLQCLPLTF